MDQKDYVVNQVWQENQAVRVNQDNVVDQDPVDNQANLVLVDLVASVVQSAMLVNLVRQAKRALSKR